MITEVKICGIRTADAAEVAIDAGADYLGFIFIPSSKRLIGLPDAKKIINQVKGRIKTVGLFANHPLNDVYRTAHTLALDFVQLHGSEAPSYCDALKVDVIKAFPLTADFNIQDTIRKMQKYNVGYYLVDRQIQGQGEGLNLEKVKTLGERFRLFVAGGLNPENVAEVVRIAQPHGVDVAGGIETNGVQDLEKIKSFIQNAKGVVI